MSTKLYRQYDCDDQLLYVGISMDAGRRSVQHLAKAHWKNRIMRIEIEDFPSKEAALEAEKIAIRNEQPAHNLPVGRRRGSCAGKIGGIPIKDKLISIRVDRADRILLERAAMKMGRRLSDYIRTAAMVRAARDIA